MDEIWKRIPETKWYEASHLGRVRSWKRKGPGQYRAQSPRLIKFKKRKDQRLEFTIFNNGAPRSTQVSQVILETFIGNRPGSSKNWQASHLNGICTDNRLCNLAWETTEANQRRRVVHGTSNEGTKNGRSKLQWSQIDTIKQRSLLGETRAALAIEFGVTATVISRIARGLSWKRNDDWRRGRDG